MEPQTIRMPEDEETELRSRDRIDSLDYELSTIVGRSVRAVLADALRDIDEAVRVLRFASAKAATEDAFEDVRAIADRLTTAADELWIAAGTEMRRMERAA